MTHEESVAAHPATFVERMRARYEGLTWPDVEPEPMITLADGRTMTSAAWIAMVERKAQWWGGEES